MAHIRYAQFPRFSLPMTITNHILFEAMKQRLFFQIGAIKSLFLPAYLPILYRISLLLSPKGSSYLEKVIMLTQNEIKQITQAADVLQKWHSYVSKKGSDDLGCHIALLASVETTIDQAMDVSLTKNPKLGQDIKTECEKLLSDANLVEDLREVNASEARLKEIELLGPARRLISRFQQIAQIEREELSSETPTETEQDINPPKRGRIWTGLKGFIKEAYRITIKSFFDSVMDK